MYLTLCKIESPVSATSLIVCFIDQIIESNNNLKVTGGNSNKAINN